MLGLPAGSWTKFERDRAIADIGLIELVRSQGHLLLEDALKYLDLRVEALGELVLGAAIEAPCAREATTRQEPEMARRAGRADHAHPSTPNRRD